MKVTDALKEFQEQIDFDAESIRMALFSGTVGKPDWAYGTVIEKRQGTVWSRAMYIGRGKDGSHIGTILGTSFGLGFGVDPGDRIHIAPEDWEKVDE